MKLETDYKFLGFIWDFTHLIDVTMFGFRCME
jgi:hypothetical protein